MQYLPQGQNDDLVGGGDTRLVGSIALADGAVAWRDGFASLTGLRRPINRRPLLQERPHALLEVLALDAEDLVAVLHGHDGLQALRIDGVVQRLLGQTQAERRSAQK